MERDCKYKIANCKVILIKIIKEKVSKFGDCTISPKIRQILLH